MATPSTGTCASSIASSKADCVFGVARLISSASTIWAKIGPWPELEPAGLLVEDADAGDVARQQIGRELNPLERRADAARDRFRQHRFADAWHIFDQDVAAAKQRHQHELDFAPFADYDLFDVGRGSLASS